MYYMFTHRSFILLMFSLVVFIFNLAYLWKYPKLTTLISSLILIFIYQLDFSYLQIKSRLLIFITLFLGLYCTVSEIIILALSKSGCWKYGNPFKNSRVPLDLPISYSILVVFIIVFYKSIEVYEGGQHGTNNVKQL